MTQAQARLQFADWLKNAHPEIFARAVRVAEKSTATLQSLGEEETKSFWQKFGDAAIGIGTTYLSLKNQRDAMKINLERAQAGLPPIDASTSAPVIKTQVDLSPELTNRLVSTAGEGLNKTLMFAGAAVLALFLFMKK